MSIWCLYVRIRSGDKCLTVFFCNGLHTGVTASPPASFNRFDLLPANTSRSIMQRTSPTTNRSDFLPFSFLTSFLLLGEFRPNAEATAQMLMHCGLAGSRQATAEPSSFSEYTLSFINLFADRRWRTNCGKVDARRKPPTRDPFFSRYYTMRGHGTHLSSASRFWQKK